MEFWRSNFSVILNGCKTKSQLDHNVTRYDLHENRTVHVFVHTRSLEWQIISLLYIFQGYTSRLVWSISSLLTSAGCTECLSCTTSALHVVPPRPQTTTVLCHLNQKAKRMSPLPAWSAFFWGNTCLCLTILEQCWRVAVMWIWKALLVWWVEPLLVCKQPLWWRPICENILTTYSVSLDYT